MGYGIKGREEAKMIMLNGLKNSAKIFPNFLNKWKTEGCAY
jgi:hypothetical protein